MMKKILFWCLGLLLVSTSLGATFAQDFYYNLHDKGADSSKDLWTTAITQDVVSDQKGSLNALLEKFGLNTAAYAGNDKATAYVRVVMNYFLGLATFVALIMLVYGFYMMFFSGQEEGLKKAKGILKGVFIALVILGLSRFIVSYLFGVFATVNATQ